MFVTLSSFIIFIIIQYTSYYLSKNYTEKLRLQISYRVCPIIFTSLIPIVVSLELYYNNNKYIDLQNDYTHNSQFFMHISRGYFLWDLYVCLTDVKNNGIAFVFHAIICFSGFCIFSIPYYQYYGMIFLLYEFSSPYVHIMYFLLKLDLDKTIIFKIIQTIFVSAFFIVRIIMGSYHGVMFTYCMINDTNLIGYISAVLLFGSTILNYFWFYKIVCKIASF